MSDCYENCKDLRNGVCPPIKMFCSKKLAEHDKRIRAEVIAEISREMRVLYGNEYEKKIRADAISDCIQWIVSKFSYIDELNVTRIRCNASTIEINMKEQLMQEGAKNE